MKGKISFSETQSLTSERSLSIWTLQRDINKMPSSTPSAPPSFRSVFQDIFLVPSLSLPHWESVTKNCLHRNCGMPRPAPGIISAKSEDWQGGHRAGVQTPVRTPGRDLPVWLGTHFCEALERFQALHSRPVPLPVWSPSCPWRHWRVACGSSNWPLAYVTGHLKRCWTQALVWIGFHSHVASSVRSSPSDFSSYPLKINRELDHNGK